MSSKTEANHAFLTLDAMRGIAALLVLVGHAGLLFGIHPYSAYLAVDLFFVLSGFVLAYAYDPRFARGMGATAFIRIRLIRLYPLYFLGLIVVSCGIVLELLLAEHAKWTPAALGVSLAFALGFLPTPPGIAPRGAIYPLNTPAWSLGFELIVNLAFAIAWRRLTTVVLLIIVVVSGVALIIAARFYHSLAAGSDWPTMLGGFPRVFYSFTLGVLLLRLYRDRNFRIPAGWILPVLAMFVVFVVEPPQSFRPYYDLICVILVFPLLVLAGATSRPTGFAIPLYAFLGAVSYAVYVLHFPIFEMTFSLLTRITHGNLQPLQPWAGLAFLGLSLAIAYAADVAYDGPLRKWLMQNWLRVV